MIEKSSNILKITHLFSAVTLFVAIASLTSCGKNDDTPAKPIKYNFDAIHQSAPWLDIAKSQFIVEGTYQVDTNKIKEIRKTESDYIKFDFSIGSVLKGDIPSKEINVTKYIYSKKEKPDFSKDTNLFLLNGKKSILFLVKSSADTSTFFISGQIINKALLPGTEEIRKSVISEIKQQEDFTDSNKFFTICPNDKNSARVKELIADMHNGAKANDAYIELEKMGFDAVPGMICQMDDRRELAQKHISLENKNPKAWEAFRHYSPKVVVDVLDAILNQITGLHFGFIVNGGTEVQRANAVRGWRTYLWHAVNDSLEQKKDFYDAKEIEDSVCTFDTKALDSIEWKDESLPFEINGNHLVIQERTLFLQDAKTLSKKGIICFSKDKKYAKVTQAIQRKDIAPTLGYSLFEFKSDTLKRCNLTSAMNLDSIMKKIDKTMIKKRKKKR